MIVALHDGIPFDNKQLIDSLKAELNFDFVGLAPVADTESPELMWKFAAGNTNTRFERIVLPPGVGVMGIVYGSERPLIVDNVSRDIARKDQYQYPIVAAEGLVSFFALPLMQDERLVAILLCAYRFDHAITQVLLERTASFVRTHSGYALSLDSAVRPSHRHDELVYADTAQKVLHAQEEERKRISRELHDGIQQEILLAQIELRKLKYLDPAQKDAGIERSANYLRQIMKHVSTMATGLRPTLLDELGLGAAIESYCALLQEAHGVEITCTIEEGIYLGDNTETALYRVFQEAAMNACKYSRTESIDVGLCRIDSEITLSIRDYGIGFAAENPTVQGSGLGIEGMKERADLVGGILTIESSPEAGTLVSVRLFEEGKD